MIRYTLVCEHRHEFEAWFASSAAYDAQAKKGQVLCPVCGTGAVSKGVMTPNVSTRSARPRPPASREDALNMVRQFRKQVTENFEDVGERFAEEARKIHYRESEPRSIVGSATEREAKELREEGVDFHPLPGLPEDQN